MDKINTFFLAKYLQLKNKADRFMEEEDGMEVLQAVILVAIALVVAAGMMAVLGNINEEGTDGDGLLGKIARNIQSTFSKIIAD